MADNEPRDWINDLAERSGCDPKLAGMLRDALRSAAEHHRLAEEYEQRAKVVQIVMMQAGAQKDMAATYAAICEGIASAAKGFMAAAKKEQGP